MKCRHCDNSLSNLFLDLGSSPHSNAYLSADALSAPELWFPLRVLQCDSCWLVQTEDFSAPDQLFSEDYAYFSSTSKSWLRHAEQYTLDMIQRFQISSSSMVSEVAANDGYLLQFFKHRGVPSYGIEPTASTAKAARDVHGLEIVEDFFGTRLAKVLAAEGRTVDLVAANNVLAHVPDINDFVKGFSILLKPSGVATFEFPSLKTLVDKVQFDTVYHEHFSYLSLTSVSSIFAANGLQIFDVSTLPTHGGSLRVFAQRADTPHRSINSSVQNMLAEEHRLGMNTNAFYQGFQSRVGRLKNDLVSFLIEAQKEGKTVVGYGAAAKGNTILNYAGVRNDLISYIVDNAEAKQGKFMPGSRIPILSPKEIERTQPDYILILPWNLREEISSQMESARLWGARFVVASPSLEVF
ncbi:hypothetical protein RHODOSMS8_00394 [Rhodobiaceae bacterium]|nr:hypothetical protein RHODOSMS8_00394 [Rhodobiaceae bacterium]